MKNTIKIDLERPIAPISPLLFGSFVEHLGRGVYGGIYEPDSLLSNANGFRLDVLGAVRQLGVTSIRWPGGNFVSGYHWMDGVGLASGRPSVRELAWGTIESNQFGTHEFIEFCRQVGAAPFICTNMGTGSPQQAADWVEYCNRPIGSRFADLRAKNGHAEPFGVRYWGIGNELNGRWQIGQLSAEDYAKKAREAAKQMHWTDPSIKLIVAGNCTNDPDCVDWDRILLEQTAPYIDMLSLHMYAENHKNDFACYMATGERVERKIKLANSVICAARHRTGTKHPIKINFDEWNVYYREDSSPNNGNMIEEKYNFEDALVFSMFLNAFVRNCDTVAMANQSMLVNTVAPILANSDGICLQTIYYPFQLYSTFARGKAVDYRLLCDSYSVEGYDNIGYLDCSVIWNSETGKLAIFVVNRHATQSLITQIAVDGKPEVTKATVYELYHNDVKAENSFATPSRVATSERHLQLSVADFEYEFPPHSLTVIVLEVCSYGN